MSRSEDQALADVERAVASGVLSGREAELLAGSGQGSLWLRRRDWWVQALATAAAAGVPARLLGRAHRLGDGRPRGRSRWQARCSAWRKGCTLVRHQRTELRRRVAELTAGCGRTLCRCSSSSSRLPRQDPEGRPVRHALEFRSRTFEQAEDLRSCCVSTTVACVLADTAGRWPKVEEDTAGLPLRAAARRRRALHQRLRRPSARRAGRSKLKRWRKDAYVYFDNDAKGYAPARRDAAHQRLRAG